MRQLVTIKTIDTIAPIEGADRIELATIGGWPIVVAKNLHHEGDKVAYFEIDTFMPETNPLFAEYVARGVKKTKSPYTGEEVTGHVLRTVKLRGQYSQGTVMPLEILGLDENATQEEINTWMENNGVFKWEAPASFKAADIKGDFPSIVIGTNTPTPIQVRKTDSERVQNLTDEFLASLNPEDWYATEKLDGTSATFITTDWGQLRIASRNNELRWFTDEQIAEAEKQYRADTEAADKAQAEAEAAGDENFKRPKVAKRLTKGTFQKVAESIGLDKHMETGQVIQGEIVGPGIQSNKLKLERPELRIFHVEGVDPESEFYKEIIAPRLVPVLDFPFPKTVAEALAQVDGMKSTINPKVLAEGVVWWNKNNETFPELDDRANFKAINNKFLLKNKE